MMIGYRVTATSINRGFSKSSRGLLEGSPKLEAKAKEFAAKQVLNAMLRTMGGGPFVTVADILSKPLQGLGSAAGHLIAQNLLAIIRYRGNEWLQVHNIDVTLIGDFEGAYRIKDSGDMDELPKLLALIPKANTDDEFMGESVLEDAFLAHVAFAYYLRNVEHLKVTAPTKSELLEIKIEL
jgi:hypothetical protein